MGLLFIGFITLVVGLFGIEFYINAGSGDPVAWIGGSLFGVAAIGAIALTGVAFYAYKANSAFGASVFGWVAFSLFLLAIFGGAFGDFITVAFGANWMIWVVVAIFYFIFAIWAFLAGTPKLLLGVLVLTALVFLFLGLAINATGDSVKTMYLLLGIFAVIDFVLATYLGLALTEECAKCGKFKII